MWDKIRQLNNNFNGTDWRVINRDIVPVLREMESNGISFDVDLIKKISVETEAKISEVESAIYKACGGREFNLNSPIQMAEILFSEMKLPTEKIRKNKGGAFSTAASELEKIKDQSPAIPLILEYRELAKLLSTYLRPLPQLVDQNSRLHTTYGQDTSTGRISSTYPNLQNIPTKGELGPKIRQAFRAGSDKLLIAADYSQIELRIVASLADDKTMIEAFNNGVDIHTQTAAEIFNVDKKNVTKEQRRFAKTINFGIVYGMSSYGLSQSLNISVEDASNYINKYFSVYKGIKNYMNEIVHLARTCGYVETLFGFTRTFANLNSPYRNIAEGEERMAINTPIQGSAAEIQKLAMINLSKELKKTDHYHSEPKMLLTIHDEIIVEADKDDIKVVSEKIKNILENVVKLPAPLKVEIEVGENWNDMEPVK